MRAKKCRCKKDQDGQCASCRTFLVTATTRMGAALLEYLRGMDHLKQEMDRLKTEMERQIDEIRSLDSKVCVPCTRQYSDLALAKMILSFDGTERRVAESVVQSALLKAKQFIKRRPLMEKAWSDLRIRNGWK